jgi:RNA polymerase sigma-70 factor, ECF subfamily
MMSDPPWKGLRLGTYGDESAQTGTHLEEDELWLVIWRRIFRYAYLLVRNQADAEDITQEAFVTLFQETNAGRPVEKVRAWMRTVARNVSNQQFRKVRPDLHQSIDALGTEGSGQLFDQVDPSPSIEEVMIEENLLALGAKVLRELPAKDQESVMMYFRGYDFNQIGTALGISRWTASRKTLKALQKLQRRIDRSPK